VTQKKADDLEDMDEELARARRQKDGDDVDIYKHRRRYRMFKAILLGASLAGLTWLVLAMIDGGANPCEKVRTYLCKQDAAGLPCKSYETIVDESKNDSSPEMRSNVRSQCEQKIQRLKEEEGVDLK
jgi:hypothetical protein